MNNTYNLTMLPIDGLPLGPWPQFNPNFVTPVFTKKLQ